MSGILRVLSSSFREEVYLTRPEFCRNYKTLLSEEPHWSDITTNGFKNTVENNADSDEELNDKRHKTFKYLGDTELVTSSKYLESNYEVQEVLQTLKEANLTSPQAFECLASYVDSKNHELDEIFKLLKDVCNTLKLPLAQTWTVSSRSSFVAKEGNTEMTCNRFNTSCIGKVCMSTAGLPFYVHDLRFWNFREACREHNLLKSKGVVGRVLASHGSCFCADVTKLQENEYSLVHNARMSGLTSCFAVYLHSNEHNEGYILEFFLPVDMKEDVELQNLVQMMKMHFKFSYLEFGDLSSMDVIGMQMEATQLLLAVQLDPHEVGESNAQTDYINSQDQCDFDQVSHMNRSTVITNSEEQYIGDIIMNREEMFVDDATSKNIDVVTCSTTRRRKRKMKSITPTREASRILDELSKESDDDSIDTSSSKPSQAHSGVYQASPEMKKVVNVLDTRIVTVKATFKDDMIKFQLPLSSGVLELKKQVARRLKLNSTRLRLKYMDEDNDLILISCDSDFHNLMPFSVGKNAIKLIVEMVDN